MLHTSSHASLLSKNMSREADT